MSSQGPPTRTCAVNAAAERDPAPVLSRYRRPAKSQREASTWLPTQGRRRLDFHLAISAARLRISTGVTAECTKKKRIEKCAVFQNCMHFNKLSTLKRVFQLSDGTFYPVRRCKTLPQIHYSLKEVMQSCRERPIFTAWPALVSLCLSSSTACSGR